MDHEVGSSPALHRHGGDIYSYQNIRDFSANINFRGMPEPVRAAAVRAVDLAVHYPDPDYRKLRAALASREQAANPRIAPGQIVCGNGAAELMFALASCLRPHRALLPVPSFFEYEQALVSCGCAVEHFMLREEDSFALDGRFAKALSGADTGSGEAGWRGRPDMVILGNPNNPTGRLIESGVLERILDICLERGIFVVLDESFFDFLCDDDLGKTFSGTECIDRYPNLMVLKSFTKMYAIPGLRFGYAVCSGGSAGWYAGGRPERILSDGTPPADCLRTVLQPWNVSLPAQEAACAAASELAFAQETARQIRCSREEMKRRMEQAGFRVYPSAANYLLFRGSPKLKEECVKLGFLIRDCGNYPGLCPDRDGAYFRICIRSREENEELLAALCAAERM